MLKPAEKAGADVIVLCDTNGGSLPEDVFRIVTELKEYISAPLGIHTHNDFDLAVANSLAAIRAELSMFRERLTVLAKDAEMQIFAASSRILF